MTKTEKPDIAQLVEELHREMPHLRQKYAIRSLAFFGSWARGEQRSDSDFDLLVEFERVPGLLRFLELESELSDLLGVPVDLVQKEALKPAIGRRILREARPISRCHR